MPDRPNVVIVDDDHGLRRALQTRCEEIGLGVRSFSDLLDAMRSVAEDPPDLIIFDVNMGTGNGLQACEALAGPKRDPHIPVIIMSGDADATTQSRARVAGARYVRKGAHLWDRIASQITAALSIHGTDDRHASMRIASSVT